MSGGIYVGGKYMPKSHKCTTFATEFYNWYYYTSSDILTAHSGVNSSDVEGMYHCSPVVLAFWDEYD